MLRFQYETFDSKNLNIMWYQISISSNLKNIYLILSAHRQTNQIHKHFSTLLETVENEYL